MFEDVEQFKILNEVFKEFDEEESYDKILYDDILRLANIILDSRFPLVLGDEEDEYKDINESIQDAYEFFLSVKPEYAERFLNILNAPEIENNQEVGKEVKFIFNGSKDRSVVKKNGVTNISCINTLEDSETIVHEFTHKFSGSVRIDEDDVCPATIRDFFCEVPSITMEFPLYDYLKQKYSAKEALNLVLKRLDNTYQVASEVLFENIMYKLYKKSNNYIDGDILVKYLSGVNATEEEAIFFKRSIDDIVEAKTKYNRIMIFKESKRYIIGVLYGAYFYNSYCKQRNNSLNTLFILISVLGTNDYNIDKCLQRLTKANFPGVSEEGIDINDDVVELFKENLKQFEQYINNEFELLEQQTPKM